MTYETQGDVEYERAYKLVMDSHLSEDSKKAVKEHVSFLNAKGSSIRTISKHLYCLWRFSKFVKPDFDFKTATKAQIQEAIANLETSKGYSPETKRMIRVVLKSTWRHMKGDDIEYGREVSWITTGQKRKDQRLPETIITEDDVYKMIDATTSLRNRAILAVLYESGSRISEFLNLTKGSCDLSSNPGHIIVHGPKGSRKIPILFSNAYLASYLDTIKSRPDNSPLWSVMKVKRDSVGKFVSSETEISNRKADYRGISKMLKNAAMKCGINKPCSPHAYRRARATFLAGRLTSFQLQSIFGWKSIKTSESYVYLSQKDIDGAFQKAMGVEVSENDSTPKLKPKKCPRCGYLGNVDSLHCSRCGSPYNMEQVMQAEDRMQEFMAEVFRNPETKNVYIQKLAELEYKSKKKKKIDQLTSMA